MHELPGKIRMQDAVLANMVSIAAVLEYLDSMAPGAKAQIDARAQEIARSIRQSLDSSENPSAEEES